MRGEEDMRGEEEQGEEDKAMPASLLPPANPASPPPQTSQRSDDSSVPSIEYPRGLSLAQDHVHPRCVF